jgi:D-serine deaminase-like pyridoxal phosphate-dependent protein
MNLYALRTPCLVLDYKKVRHNARVMSERAGSLGVRLRPHMKTHKCIEIAQLQCSGNPGSITVSTLEEVRIFASVGFSDILYAVPIEPGKFSDVVELSKQCEGLLLLTDDASIPPILSRVAERSGVKFNVLVEVDCGYGRSGVQPSTNAVFELVRMISESCSLEFSGLLTHAGHSYHARSREELVAIASEERDVMDGCAQQLRKAGFQVPLVSIGSTPTMSVVDHLHGIDEARPGNYIFFDVFQATLGTCRFEDCALSVLAAVVSRDWGRRRVVFDAGAIALSKDHGPVEFDLQCGYGQVVDLEGNDLGIRLSSLSQEHGLATVTNDAIFDQLKVGMRVRILVNHSCLAAAQHDCYYILDDGEIVDRWRRYRGW